MFRNLIPALADKYHVVAPDYPGYGRSSQPPVSEFSYTFDNLAATIDVFTRQLGLAKFAMYVQDYGAPVGFRIATAHPERISGIIVQNGNAYVEGLPDGFWAPLKEFWRDPTPQLRSKLEGFLTLDTTKWQYLHGARDPQNISPDAYLADQAVLDRPGNKDVQIALFKDYGSNPPLYPAWQEYFRTHQPPMLIVWGKNDQIFPAAGAEPFKRDLKNLDFNLLDTGHFALEEDGDLIAAKIRAFMEERVAGHAPLIPAPRGGFDAYIFSKHPGYDEAAARTAFKNAVPARTVVVYCFDPRCERVPEVLAKVMPGEVYPGEIIRDARGNKVGSTRTIMPVVVAGGRAIDALRSITVVSHLFGFQNLVVVHHTNCGATTFTADGLTRAFRTEQGVDISRAYNRRDVAIPDFNTSLGDDIKLLRESPGVPRNVTIYGYVYNTDTDQMTLMREDRATAAAATR
jgi:pimeloyl-ACP methyl ester carboxylesterase/carbonic anhydrase